VHRPAITPGWEKPCRLSEPGFGAALHHRGSRQTGECGYSNSSGGPRSQCVAEMLLETKSAGMSAPSPEVAEVLPPVSGSIVFLAIVAVVCSVYGLAEHLIVPLEARDIVGRLNQKSK
jgi:hypothetical protein